MKTQHGDDPLLAKSGSSSAVIGPQFCEPNCEVDLTIITDDNGNFVSVKDVKGNVVFHIKDETTLVHERRLLLDVVGNHVITLQRKKKSIHKKWKVCKGEKKHSKDLLFSARGPSSVDKFPTKLDCYYKDYDSPTDVVYPEKLIWNTNWPHKYLVFYGVLHLTS